MDTVRFKPILIVSLVCASCLALAGTGRAESLRTREPISRARADTLDMTCGQATGLVNRAGDLLLNSGPSRYDLYHSNGSSCYQLQQVQQPAYVPTRDVRYCFVGFTCQPPDLNGRDRF